MIESRSSGPILARRSRSSLPGTSPETGRTEKGNCLVILTGSWHEHEAFEVIPEASPDTRNLYPFRSTHSGANERISMAPKREVLKAYGAAPPTADPFYEAPPPSRSGGQPTKSGPSLCSSFRGRSIYRVFMRGPSSRSSFRGRTIGHFL